MADGVNAPDVGALCLDRLLANCLGFGKRAGLFQSESVHAERKAVAGVGRAKARIQPDHHDTKTGGHHVGQGPFLDQLLNLGLRNLARLPFAVRVFVPEDILKPVRDCLDDEGFVELNQERTPAQRATAQQLAKDLVDVAGEANGPSPTRRVHGLRKSLEVAMSAGLSDWERTIELALYDEANSLGDYATIYKVAIDGALRGELVGDERRRFHALLQLSYVAGYRQQNLDAMNEYARLARSSMHRLGRARDLELDLRRNHAIHLWGSKGADAALPVFGELYLDARFDSRIAPSARIRAYCNYGVALQGMGRIEDAMTVFRAGTQVAVRDYGETHASVASVLALLVQAQGEAGYRSADASMIDEILAAGYAGCETLENCVASKPEFLAAMIVHLRLSGRFIEQRQILRQLDELGDELAEQGVLQLHRNLERAHSAYFFRDTKQAEALLRHLFARGSAIHPRDLYWISGPAIALLRMLKEEQAVTKDQLLAWADFWQGRGQMTGGLLERAAVIVSNAQLADLREDKSRALELSSDAYQLVASSDLWGNSGAFQVRIFHAELLQFYGQIDEAKAQLQALRKRTSQDLGVDSIFLLHIDRALAQNAALRGDFFAARTLQARALQIAELHAVATEMANIFERDATRWEQRIATVGTLQRESPVP